MTQNYINCPICSKPFIETDRTELDTVILITGKCGHSIVQDLVVSSTDTVQYPQFKDGRKYWKFQEWTHDKVIKSNLRCIIANRMGYGKSINAIGALEAYPDKTLPAIITCKKSLTVQFAKEVILLTGRTPFVMSYGGDSFVPGFDIYIVSHDLVKRIPELITYPFKTVIIDECQQIKNPTTKRAASIKELVSGGVRRKRKIELTLKRRMRIQTIAEDLMAYHGLISLSYNHKCDCLDSQECECWCHEDQSVTRFRLQFEELIEGRLGQTECRVVGEGIINGKISLSKPHCENDSEEEVIETILHEIAHAITPGAGHRPIWSETARSIGSNGLAFAWCKGTSEPQGDEIEEPKNVIALSGTPIKNHAGEYFTILNMLHPERFPTYTQYVGRFCDYDYSEKSPKIGGIREDRIEEFNRKTEDFIIRTKEDIGLPPIRRNFRYHELGEAVRSAYQKTMGEFFDEMDKMDGRRSFADMSNILAYLAKMRHLTGLAKIDPVVDYVEEFLESSNEKLAIFYHHNDVGTILEQRINQLCKEKGIPNVINLTSESPVGAELPFTSDVTRKILLASTLAKGEGLNLQVCNNAVIMERQWNPANEEQAEARFCRIGSTAESVEIVYPTAIDTIDEWLGTLVEKKRTYFASTIEGVWKDYNESSLLKDLIEIANSQGRRKWGWK